MLSVCRHLDAIGQGSISTRSNVLLVGHTLVVSILYGKFDRIFTPESAVAAKIRFAGERNLYSERQRLI